ncbi:hypothetical protein KSB_39310 [Ktedonobacter robiniae]|uniref:Uncharacterized protein n=1 Tax=Ktedonobacter robiniae TaxID=2778365 RepID=A0ABQ3URZ2_9CHLR|nr:hypothetical protein KSB_39310 [Ktedonobacter robiniae]
MGFIATLYSSDKSGAYGGWVRQSRGLDLGDTISHAMYDKIIILVGVLNQFAQALHMHVNLCGRFAC